MKTKTCFVPSFISKSFVHLHKNQNVKNTHKKIFVLKKEMMFWNDLEFDLEFES